MSGLSENERNKRFEWIIFFSFQEIKTKKKLNSYQARPYKKGLKIKDWFKINLLILQNQSRLQPSGGIFLVLHFWQGVRFGGFQIIFIMFEF